MTRLEEFNEYCDKTGLPDSVAAFALFNAWIEAEEKLKNITERHLVQLDFEKKNEKP